MKSTKVITAVIVFIGAFAFSTGLVWLFVGFPETKSRTFYYQPTARTLYADDIESLINQDVANGYGRSSRIYSLDDRYVVSPANPSFADYAEAVEDYSNDSGSLDASYLPQDFQSAWRKHMKAWRDYSNFLNMLKNKPESKKVSAIHFNQMDEDFSRNINQTWYEVLRTGDRYGADVQGY